MRIVFRLPRACVFYNFDYEEFVVKFWRNGVYLPDADYFTDDRSDAVGTATRYDEEQRLAEMGEPA
jgi:predicted metalloendopeptidase